MRKVLCGVVSLLIIVLSVPTRGAEEGPETQAWASAITKNTVEAYASFLKKFPNTDRKDEIKKRVDSIIVELVSREIKQRPKTRVYKRGVRGTDIITLAGWVGVGARFTIGGGELRLRDEYLIITDPTDPFTFTGDKDTFPDYPYALARVLRGHGVVIQYFKDAPDELFIFVFNVDVSSVVSNWTEK